MSLRRSGTTVSQEPVLPLTMRLSCFCTRFGAAATCVATSTFFLLIFSFRALQMARWVHSWYSTKSSSPPALGDFTSTSIPSRELWWWRDAATTGSHVRQYLHRVHPVGHLWLNVAQEHRH